MGMPRRVSDRGRPLRRAGLGQNNRPAGMAKQPAGRYGETTGGLSRPAGMAGTAPGEGWLGPEAGDRGTISTRVEHRPW
jgi:hypothetical protein